MVDIHVCTAVESVTETGYAKRYCFISGYEQFSPGIVLEKS